jgi:hypothetical protein
MYRVKEVEGKFIPQVGNWFNGYRPIDRKKDFLWTDGYNEYCEFNTLEEALERIKRHKPKYHKVK